MSPANTLISATPSVTIDNPGSITVQAYDEDGNPVTSGGNTVVLSQDSNANISAITDNGDGTYTASITNNTPEIITITGSIDGVPIPDNAVVTFTPGAASGANSTITSSSNSVTTDGGATATLTLQAIDAQGNLLTSSGGEVLITTNSLTANLSAIVDNNDGTYTATISNTLAENVTISASIAGISISSGDPIIRFTLGALSAETTSITSLASSVTTDGGASTTLTIQAKDAQENNFTSSAGLVTLNHNSNTAILSAVTDNNNGIYTATVSNTVAENVTISGTISGNPINSGNPIINFTPGVASALNTSISATPNSVTTDGVTTALITVQAIDAQGNFLRQSGGVVTLSENSTAAVLSPVTDNNNGSYTATISNTITEVVTISGSIAGNNILSATPSIDFTPGEVSAANTTITLSLNTVTTDNATTSTITVQTKDAEGNNLISSSGTIVLSTDSTSAIVSPVTDNNDGTYTATISNTVAETVTISGIINTSPIIDTAEITFTPGIASVLETLLSASPLVLRANGLDQSTITLVLRDISGNILPVGVDTVLLNANNSAIISTVINNNDGSYTATVTNTEVGTSTITATLNGLEISNQTNIQFIAYGSAQINDSDGQFVNGTAPPGASISVYDSDGVLLCTTTADSISGYYHCVITSPLANSEQLTITTTDLAGNDESSSTNVLFEDSDNDGISDIIETELRNNGGSEDTNIFTDTDGDLLPDYAEVILGSDYLSPNSPIADGHLDDDNDGVTNAVEYFLSEFAGVFDAELSTDTDQDGIPDVTELITENASILNSDKPTLNGLGDDNANGVSNAVEAYLQTFSINNITLNSDYDGDGYPDTLEVRLSSNPLFANEADLDNDGVNNAVEAFLTGTINGDGNTALRDSDNDGLPDIFEISALTDRSDPSDKLNLANNTDSDNDGITDAVELYLYGNTNDASLNSDIDLDGIPDIEEVTIGSNAFKRSSPSIWIDIEFVSNDTIELKGNVAGVQSPAPVLTWNLSGLNTDINNLIETSPNPSTIRLSGLDMGIHTVQLTMTRDFNGTSLSSVLNYTFQVTQNQFLDSDKDGVTDAYDAFDGLSGEEELLHTSLIDLTRYRIQTQIGHVARLGTIAKLSDNQVANVSNTQIEEMVEYGKAISLGSPNNPSPIAQTNNLFDFEILNLPETANTVSVVIPLHHALPVDPIALKFEANASIWSSFINDSQNSYSTAQGVAGSCPTPNDAQYTQGLTSGHYCLQLNITDGGPNDADNLANGSIQHLSGIGSSTLFPIGEISTEQLDDTFLTTEESDDEVGEPAPVNESSQSSTGAGSIDHITLIMFGLLSLSLFSTAKAGPSGGNIVHGTGDINVNSNLTTITQNTDRLAIDWQSFNVANGEEVNFIQPNGSSIVLNKDFSGLPSEIFGNINANGQVLLLNSAGILIGESASINVGSFLASDLLTSTEDFSLGNFTLRDQNPSQGGITNHGTIQTKGRSGIFIAGQFIDNNGSLLSSNGDIHLSTASEVIVSTSEDGLLGVQLTEALKTEISPSGNLIYNDGDIVATNGNIYLDLFYSDSIKANTVNNDGIINAIKITEGNGKVFLSSSIATKTTENTTELNGVISESQSDPDVNTSLEIELTPPARVSIDTIMPDCKPGISSEESDVDCSKYQAIKNYLSRLLLGGELPEY